MNIAGYFLRIWNIMVCNEQHANVWTSCTPCHVIHPVVINKVYVTAVFVNFRMWFHSLRKSTVEVVELLVPVWELRESWRFWTRYVRILCHWLQTMQWLRRSGHWLLTVESQVWSEVSSHGFCGGQSDNGTGFSLRTVLFPCLFHSSTLHTQTSVTPHSDICHQFFKLSVLCIFSAYEMKNQQMSLFQFYSYIDGSLHVSGPQAHPQESSHSCSHNHWFSVCTALAVCSVCCGR